MISYKVIETTVPYFLGIEIPFDFSLNKPGDLINILGHEMTITQLSNVVVGCANKENIIILKNSGT
jgi:hypothetical protein